MGVLHIIMFPWFAYGHIIPYIQLANKLAEKGHKITFLIPTNSKHKIKHLNHHPNLIIFHSLTIPHVDGLPAGAETRSDVSPNLIPLIAVAMDRTRDQVEDLINSTNPNIVFHDFSYWLTQITKPRQIKTIYFVVGCAAMVAHGADKFVKGPDFNEDELALPPNNYPSKTVILHSHEADAASFLSSPFGENITFYDRLTIVRKECDIFAIRTCREMEGHFCNYIATRFRKPVCLTGPIVLDESVESLLEDKLGIWLDGFGHGSVVFCSFGSEWIVEKDQFQEILLGFESSGYPFLIAMKPPIGSSTVEEAFPNGYEERIKGRGLVCGGWVPQREILKHRSVGCFVNHSGSGAMWESLVSDCQIVVLPPNRRDFILHARLLAAELEVAVEAEKEENGWVSRENLSKAISNG